LKVVEDATESLGTYYNGKHTGSFGIMGCFSFNGNKIITTGGGGVLVTDDEELAKKAKHLTTQAKSDPFEYVHDEVGYNYRLVNVLAAMGVAQMELLPSFIRRKKEINTFYRDNITGIGDISFQKIEPEVDCNMWLFTIMTENQKQVLKVLNDNQMQSRPFWVPMNQLKMFRSDIYYNKEDNSDYLYKRCLSIPCSTNIKDEEMQSVVDRIQSVY
jgi:perosamine synthetase